MAEHGVHCILTPALPVSLPGASSRSLAEDLDHGA